jgi:hypothetical protein
MKRNLNLTTNGCSVYDPPQRYSFKLQLVRKLQVIFLLFLFAACKKQDDLFKQTPSDTPIISLSYKNNAGENLLQLKLNASDIDVLDLSQQGHKIYFQNSQGSNAIHVEEISTYGKVVRLPFANGIKIGNKMTKFLQYKDHSEDKITIEESYQDGKPFISKVWLNDVLVNHFEPIVILK